MTPGARRNPFSTRFHRPGALPWEGEDVAAIFDRFAQLGAAEIVGPHGTGKTTLAALLGEEAERRGWEVRRVVLHLGDRALPWNSSRFVRSGPRLLLLDGAEQLPSWRWWLVRARCRRRGIALLATTHAPRGLPILHRTVIDPQLAERVVQRILDAQPQVPRLMEPREIHAALAETGGNLREALLRLYDVYEERAASARHDPAAGDARDVDVERGS